MDFAFQLRRVHAPKRGKIGYIVFIGYWIATVLPNSRLCSIQGEPACDERLLFCLLLFRDSENLLFSVGRRQAGKIGETEFCLLRRLLAGIRQNLAVGLG